MLSGLFHKTLAQVKASAQLSAWEGLHVQVDGDLGTGRERVAVFFEPCLQRNSFASQGRTIDDQSCPRAWRPRGHVLLPVGPVLERSLGWVPLAPEAQHWACRYSRFAFG